MAEAPSEKMWYQSKEVGFNILMTFVDIVSLATDLKLGGQSLAPILAFLHGGGNIFLRIWFTNSPIKKQVLPDSQV